MKRAVLIACSGLLARLPMAARQAAPATAAPLVARVAETGFIQIEAASLRPLDR